MRFGAITTVNKGFYNNNKGNYGYYDVTNANSAILKLLGHLFQFFTFCLLNHGYGETV